MVPEPCRARAAGLPALQWMETLLGELPALPERGRAEVPAGSRATAAPGCRALGGCAGAVPRWDSGGTALPPAPSRGNTRRGCPRAWAGLGTAALFPSHFPCPFWLCCVKRTANPDPAICASLLSLMGSKTQLLSSLEAG